LVPQVVRIQLILVLLEPMPVVQQRVIHVPLVLTALLVPQVVRIQIILVLLEPMPVVQQRVIHVPVILTALLVPQVVRIQLILVLLEPMPVVQQRVIHAPVVLTALVVKQCVILVHRASTTIKRNAQQKLIAKHVPVVLSAWVVHPVAWSRVAIIRPPTTTTLLPI